MEDKLLRPGSNPKDGPWDTHPKKRMLKTFLKTHLKLVILGVIAMVIIGAYPLASRAILIFSQSLRSNPNLENGLIAYWSFDGGHATSSNATLVTTASSSVSSGAGDNNGFETTSGTGLLDAAVLDTGYMRDTNSGSATSVDGCGTFPQSEDDQHVFQDFNISVSSVTSNDPIKGIQLFTVGKVDSATGNNLFCIALSWDGGTSWTAAESSADLGITDQVDFYGSSFYKWGRTWSTSELSNANFRVKIMPDADSSTSRDFDLNQLGVIVYSDGYKDHTGKGYTAIPQNAVIDAVGKIGSAVYFEGTETGLDISSVNSAVNTNTGSIALWMKRDFADSITTDKNVFTIFTDISNYLSLNYDNFNDRWSYVHVRGGTLDEATTPVSAIGTSTWSHVVATWDTTADTIKLYVDGVERSSSSGLGTWSGTLLISLVSDTSTSFLGSIDDFRIYTRALSIDEIKRLYQVGATSKINTSMSGANTALENGLVGHWTFDGADVDTSSTTGEIIDKKSTTRGDWINHATTTVPGKIGQGIQFDGVNDYVSTNRTIAQLGSGAKTIAIWVYPLDYGRTASNIYSLSPLIMDDAGYFGIMVGTSTNYGTINRIWAYNWDNTAKAADTTYAVNEWQHIVVVHDLTNLKIYRNGVLASSTLSITTGVNTGTYLVGSGYNDVPVHYSNANIDDVRIYNRALSSDEVNRLYAIGATAKVNTSMAGANTSLETGLMYYTTFDGLDVDTSSTTGEIINKKSTTRSDWGNHASTTVPGKIGQAIQFDGVDDYINAGTGIAPSSEITICAWVYRRTSRNNATAGWQDIIARSSTANTGNYVFEFNTIGVDEALVFNTGATYVAPNTVLDVKQNTDPRPFTLNTWHHLCATYISSSGTGALYWNGQSLTLHSTENEALRTTSESLFIGGRTGSSDITNGNLDDVRIYNRALSATEIKRLYDIGR